MRVKSVGGKVLKLNSVKLETVLMVQVKVEAKKPQQMR